VGGVLAEGHRAPSPPARGLGEHCKLPQQWGPGQSPSRKHILDVKREPTKRRLPSGANFV